MYDKTVVNENSHFINENDSMCKTTDEVNS